MEFKYKHLFLFLIVVTLILLVLVSYLILDRPKIKDESYKSGIKEGVLMFAGEIYSQLDSQKRIELGINNRKIILIEPSSCEMWGDEE